MEPDGDPEARIRELERSLSETARTSELGVTSRRRYAPPVYDTGQISRPPARKLRRLFLVLGAVVIAGTAGLIFYSAKPTHPHGVPTSSGVTTRPARSTLVRTPTPSAATPPSAEAPSATVVPPGSTFSVSGAHKHVVVTCDECSVNVSGVSNTVEIEGNCDNLTVSGVENIVTVGTSREISVSGFRNEVTYHSGEPTISGGGDSNAVHQG
ncbi:MAG: DUF3060 domain-containing protein [Mycobacterium sp.]